jgi:hypothetical protein
MTEGEKMVWAAVWAARWLRAIDNPPRGRTPDWDQGRYEAEEACSAAEVADSALTVLGKIEPMLADGFGESDRVVERFREMVRGRR